jgi:hypothetical protein
MGRVNLFGEDPITVTDEQFETLWLSGAWRKLGKKEAYRHFRKTVKTPDDLKRIEKARDTYAKDLQANPRQLLHGSTWFNNWEDFEVLEVKAVGRKAIQGDNHGKYAAFVRK